MNRECQAFPVHDKLSFSNSCSNQIFSEQEGIVVISKNCISTLETVAAEPVPTPVVVKPDLESGSQLVVVDPEGVLIV